MTGYNVLDEVKRNEKPKQKISGKPCQAATSHSTLATMYHCFRQK